MCESRVSNLIKEKTGIKYALKIKRTHNFDLKDNLYEFLPSVFHHNNWNKFEEFCKFISGKDDIFYGTNKEILLK